MLHARPDYQRIQDPDGLIPADEPVFLLRAQDQTAAEVVRYWAELNEKAHGHSRLTRLAREHADRMDAWPQKKRADP